MYFERLAGCTKPHRINNLFASNFPNLKLWINELVPRRLSLRKSTEKDRRRRTSPKAQRNSWKFMAFELDKELDVELLSCRPILFPANCTYSQTLKQ